jgi:hypothetical protein
LPETRTAAICRSAHKGLICRNLLLVPQEGLDRNPQGVLAFIIRAGGRTSATLHLVAGDEAAIQKAISGDQS